MKRVPTAVLAVLVRAAWFFRYTTLKVSQDPPTMDRVLSLSSEDKAAIAVYASLTLLVGLLGLNSNPLSASSIVGGLIFIAVAYSASLWIVIALITAPFTIELVLLGLTHFFKHQLDSAWDMIMKVLNGVPGNAPGFMDMQGLIAQPPLRDVQLPMNAPNSPPHAREALLPIPIAPLQAQPQALPQTPLQASPRVQPRHISPPRAPQPAPNPVVIDLTSRNLRKSLSKTKKTQPAP